LNAFEDEVLKRQALGLNPSPNSYERPMVPPTPASPSAARAARAARGGGSLDPHTLGSYKKLSDTFGTTRDRSGNVVASAAPPTVNEVRRGQLTPQNAPLSYTLGTTVDRFGNVVADPAAPRAFKDGGEAANSSPSLDEYLQQQMGGDDDSSAAFFGDAQKLMANFNEVPKVEPMRRIVKRVSRGSGGDSKTDKNMSIKVPPLAASKDMAFSLPSAQEAAETKSPGTAREQMEELVRMHQLKINAARNKARGLSADTFGAPTLEGATLTKNTLAKKRFAEGGEVKKPGEDGPSATNLLRRLGLSLARGIPQAATGLVDLAALPLTASGKMKAEDIVGTTDYLTKRGLLPKPQTGLANESAELLSSMASPGGAAKAAVVGVLGPKGIIDAARRSQLFKGKGLTVPDENFSAQEMLKMLREQGVDTERTWLRGKKGTDTGKGAPHHDQKTLEYLYEYQKRPDAIEAALRDSRRSQAVDGRTLSRQPGDRGVTKFNTKGGVWLTESPSLAQTYAGDKGFTIPVYAPKPDAVVDAKGEQWSDFYRKDKGWKEAFEDPNVRLVEVKNVIDAGPNWSSLISPDASEEELRAFLTATNLFAKKPFDRRVVNKITGEPYEFSKGGMVKKQKK
jgi:hypothetical protein